MTERECRACGAVVIEGEPDPCIGYIEGVSAACCGHGGEMSPYVAFYRPDGSFCAWSGEFVRMTADELAEAEAGVVEIRREKRLSAFPHEHGET